MKYCSYCNAQNPDDSVFCSSCGKNFPPVEQSPVQAPLPPVAPMPPVQQNYQQPQNNQNFGAYPPAPPAPPAGQYNNMPPIVPQKPGDPTKNWMGILSMIFGILSILCCFVWYISVALGAAAVIFGILGLKSQQRGMAIAGIITGGVGLLFAIAVIVFSAAMISSMPNWMDEFYNEFGYDFMKLPSFLIR